MSTISRRDFLKTSGAAGAVTASATWTVTATAQEKKDTAGATPDYPQKSIAQFSDLATNQPLSFTYPDADSPCLLLKLGTPVLGGVGPDQDIVAYSALCTHMGYPVTYHTESRTFRCPGHFSIFDPEKAGQQVCGQATEALPHIELSVADDGAIRAVGIQGHLYGRLSNLF